jgi:hypothetical protein
MNSAVLAPRLASPDPAKAALLRGNPTVRIDQADALLPGLLRDAGMLLGLDTPQAAEFARSGALALGSTLVVVTPVVDLDAELCDLLVCIDTRRPVADTDAPTAARLLQHASGLLMAHNSAIASSPDDSWMLCRRVALGGLNAEGLRAAVIVSIELAAYVFEALAGEQLEKRAGVTQPGAAGEVRQ